MTRMTVIVLERVPVSLRGELARWMIELKAGVFVGRLSALVRDKLWRKITEKKKSGGAILVQVKDNEQHFEITMDGFPDRAVVDFDGLQLVRVNYRNTGTAAGGEEVDASELPEEGPSPPLQKKASSSKTRAMIEKPAPDHPARNPSVILDLPIISTNDGSIMKQKPGHPKRPRKLDAATPASVNPPATKELPAESTTSSKGIEISALQNGFPDGFVERELVAMLKDGQLSIEKECKSTSTEHPPGQAWQAEWMTDIARACNKILEAASRPGLDEALPCAGKMIASIDIETTNYIPKAMQGFVNIIGIASMDFRETSGDSPPALHVYQLINTLRKRDLVPFLVASALQHVAGADTLLVFNKNFDIKILQMLIDQHHLACKMPVSIVDLMELFPNLESLEQELFQLTGFKRLQTQKGKYDEYYAAFKGKGSAGAGKKLEPIGTYNLLDALTPLLYYLLAPKDD